MPQTILRMLWPYVLRYLAQRSADYLDEQREKKRQLKEMTAARMTAAAEALECPPPPPPIRLATRDAVWYTVGGLLLGSAVGLIVANILRKED